MIIKLYEDAEERYKWVLAMNTLVQERLFDDTITLEITWEEGDEEVWLVLGSYASGREYHLQPHQMHFDNVCAVGDLHNYVYDMMWDCRGGLKTLLVEDFEETLGCSK